MMPQGEFVKMLNSIRQEYGLPLLSDEEAMAPVEEFELEETTRTECSSTSTWQEM